MERRVVVGGVHVRRRGEDDDVCVTCELSPGSVSEYANTGKRDERDGEGKKGRGLCVYETAGRSSECLLRESE